jgi:hypothetical protein
MIGRLRAVVLCVFALASGLSSRAAARGDAHLRVIVPRATVRTGPGFSYRELYRAERGEVLRVVDRNAAYWFRVALPDGRFGWIYGEQVLPFEIEVEGSKASIAWRKFKNAVFAPSPLPGSHVGLSFSGGALGGEGMFMFRPSVTLDSHFAFEAHVGESVGKDGSLLLYGLGGNIYIWPPGPVIPFVTLGAGGATSFPKVNGVTQASKSQFALDAGGGLLFVIRKGIVFRVDIRNYTLFTANSTDNRQEYSGGLAVFF